MFTVPSTQGSALCEKPAPHRNDSSLGVWRPKSQTTNRGVPHTDSSYNCSCPFFLFVVVVVWLCFTLVRVCDEKSSHPWCTCEHQVFIATQVAVAPSSACLAIIIIKSLTLQKLRLQMCFSLVIVNHWPLTSDFTCDECAACVNSNSAKLHRASTFQCAKVVAYEHFQRLWQVQVATWLPSPFVLLWALADCLAPETCKSTTSALAIASTDTLGEHLQCTTVAFRFYRRSSIEK